MKGSSTKSSSYVYNSINRRGSSTGNGAGCPTLFADSGGKSQTERVYSINCSAVMLALPLRLRLNRPFEKQRQYSCKSRMTGLAGDRQLPQAQLPFAPFAFRQMISARMKYPMSNII